MPSTDRPPVIVRSARLTNTPPLPTGWRSQDGFTLPETPWDLSDRKIVAAGSIDSESEASAALQALARGVGLDVSIGIGGDLRHRVLEDLHRLGAVVDVGPTDVERFEVDDEERLLLDALSDGATVAQAAAALHLSLRTANRRLAGLRSRLGVNSTAEVVTRWAHLRSPRAD